MIISSLIISFPMTSDDDKGWQSNDTWLQDNDGHETIFISP